MNTRRIGALEVSEVGLGCNNLGARIDAAASERVVHACIEEGITFFDTADSYGDGASEQLLGRALGSHRSEVVIGTKFGWEFNGEPPGRGASAAWIERAVEGSLRRLGTDYIDLYQLHRPDPDVEIEETLGALDRLVVSGKVREIGCSNFSVDQIDGSAAASASGGLASFKSVQNRYSLLFREPEAGVLDACREHGLGFLPFFPLHSGLLTGKYRADAEIPEGTRLASMPPDRVRDFYNADDLATVDRLRGFCEARGRTLLELAFSWLLARDVVSSVIAGATKPEQVASNAAAAAWRLEPDDMAEIDVILSGED